MIKITQIKIVDIIGDRATDTKQGDILYKEIVDVLPVFLNNALGALYKDYDSKFLNEYLEIKNMSPDDMFILKQVIARAKDFFCK